MRCYSDLVKLKTFQERFEYLSLNGAVGDETFGFERYLNQMFYRSREWKRVRREVIIRDMGCDLGIRSREIVGKVIIHHMNPATVDDVVNNIERLLDSEYLVCVSMETHNALHYGDVELIKVNEPVVRKKNDTCPWR